MSTSMSYLLAWLKAFALTAAIEVPIATWLFRESGGPWWRRSGLCLYANLASHPAVWFIFPALGLTFPRMVLAAEAWAVVSEAVFFWLAFQRVDARRAVGVALLANGISFGLGLVLRELTGWV